MLYSMLFVLSVGCRVCLLSCEYVDHLVCTWPMYHNTELHIYVETPGRRLHVFCGYCVYPCPRGLFSVFCFCYRV